METLYLIDKDGDKIEITENVLDDTALIAKTSLSGFIITKEDATHIIYYLREQFKL